MNHPWRRVKITKMWATVVLIIHTLLLGLAACTSTPKNVETKFTEIINVDANELYLNGVGMHKKLLFPIYSAGLYLEKKLVNADEILAQEGPKVLQLRYARALDSAAALQTFQKLLQENCQSNCKENIPSILKFYEQILQTAPLIQGRVQTYTISQDLIAVEVEGSNAKIQPIAATNIGTEFLRSFIGTNPPSESLKRGLLGNH